MSKAKKLPTKTTSKELAVEAVEQEGSKYALVKTPFLAEKQILKIFQRTPAGHIYRRKAKGGGEWEYVTGTYVKKVLNFVFGWRWNFEVVSVEEKYGQVIVLGKLTVFNQNGASIVKMQSGRADIKLKKDGSGALDYGNDEKAAITDALKKCAAELGIASDIYGKNEFRDIQQEGVLSQATTESPKNPQAEMTTEELYKATITVISKENDQKRLAKTIANIQNSKKFDASAKARLIAEARTREAALVAQTQQAA